MDWTSSTRSVAAIKLSKSKFQNKGRSHFSELQFRRLLGSTPLRDLRKWLLNIHFLKSFLCGKIADKDPDHHAQKGNYQPNLTIEEIGENCSRQLYCFRGVPFAETKIINALVNNIYPQPKSAAWEWAWRTCLYLIHGILVTNKYLIVKPKIDAIKNLQLQFWTTLKTD